MSQLRPLHAVATDPELGRAGRERAAGPETRTTAAERRRVDPWLAAGIGVAVLGLVLRTIGLSYGLPDHFHWDEPTIMNRVIRMGGGDLNPHFFYYPTLLMYTLLVANGALYAVGHVLHWYASTNDFAVSYLTDSTASYLVGRGLVATLGALTVLLAFVVGRRFVSAPAGLIGALLLAVSPVHIGNSHFATNDVPMAFFALLSYVFLWQVYTRGRTRDYLLAGAVIGLGVSTKYLPVVLLLSLALAHAFRLRNETGTWRSIGQGVSRLVAAGFVAFAAFAVTSPYVLLDWRTAIHDYGAQSQLSSAAGCQDCGLNFVPYLTQTLGWAIGWAAYLLALVGLASLLWRRGEPRLRGILLASFPIMLFLLVGSERQPWPRWLVPIAPFACIAAGGVLWAAVRRAASSSAVRSLFGGRDAPRLAVFSAVGVLTLAAAVQPAIESGRFDRSLLTSDPRTQAVRWFESSVPDGTTVAVQPMLDRYFFTAQLHTDAGLADVQSYLPPSKAGLRDAVATAYHQQPVYHQAPFVYDLAQLRSAGVRYVVISSAHFHNSGDPNEDRLYADLSSQTRVAARFTPPISLPDADDYPTSMPIITVYDLG
ncbi:MAG TPA: glycosyltransferase family 39 protein [Candidatus Dormibacteraeota bacterium]|nr:glycosyltransferase family 39 protein [Candidatus Dormibacteraeota bacterium]